MSDTVFTEERRAALGKILDDYVKIMGEAMVGHRHERASIAALGLGLAGVVQAVALVEAAVPATPVRYPPSPGTSLRKDQPK